eukprot:SAG31_NODE_1316_length_8838_cov_11.005031_2_plen_40_part_00
MMPTLSYLAKYMEVLVCLGILLARALRIHFHFCGGKGLR